MTVTIMSNTEFCTWCTMLNVFRRVYTRIFIDNYPTILFNIEKPTYGSYEYKEEGSGIGLNRKQGLVETDS